jgi:nicotinate phosphoribosyltransferase
MTSNKFLLSNLLTGLYTDYYELTMAQGYFLNGLGNRKAVFDYFFRQNPFGNGFTVFAGLSDFLDAIEKFSFSTTSLNYLKKLGFNEKFLNYLKDFKFNGSIYSVREGEIVFPKEPIVRVEGSLIETQLIETLLLNILNFESLIATKSVRVKKAANGKAILDFGMRRAQGYASLLASRAAIIGGAVSTSNVSSAFIYGLKATGTMAHSWVQSFENELTAFRKFAELYPDNCILLVDTYDTLESGLPNAIKVAKELESKGKRLVGIRLDSGDLAFFSKKARAMLDENGLDYVKIAVSNQLDENIIHSLLEQGAPIDVFGVGTNLVIGKPDAALDGVYKLASIDGKPTLKLSENIEKMTLPGKKNILRFINGNNLFGGDAIILEEEKRINKFFHPIFNEKQKDVTGLKFERLLQPVFKKGERLIRSENIEDISSRVSERLNLLDESHKRFENPHIYKVGISKRLMNLRDDLKNKIRKNF